MELYVKMSFISTFSLFFLVFRRDFNISADFTRILASNTTSDEVTNQVTHRIFNTDLLYSCAHFVVKTDENLAIMSGINRI